MALHRVVLLLFLLEILLPFCCCSDPYCALDSENQYTNYRYTVSTSSEDVADRTYGTDSSDNGLIEEDVAPVVCPTDADACVSFNPLIDQCQMNSSSSPGFYCQCDSDCEHFDDCCYGHANENASLQTNGTKVIPERQYWSCTRFTIGIEWKTVCIRDVFVVSKCPSSANPDPDLIKRCEQPMANDTVFFDSKEIFYRNRYCALCHSVSSSELIPYIIFTPCLDNRPSESKFCGQRPFLVNGSAPPSMRWCVEDNAIISQCDSQMEGGVQSPCLNETARVMINGSIYKNIDCATCNGVSVHNSSILRSDCEVYFDGRRIVSAIAFSAPAAFDFSYYYPELQCMNGLQLSGTKCVPEVGSWPNCRSSQIYFAVTTNGSLQCFDGFEILKIQAYKSHPNATIYEFKIEGTETFLVFPANILPHKTQLEDFIESRLEGNSGSKCCRDNSIIIYEICDVEYDLSTGNESDRSWITDDFQLFEPVLINGTTYIMYNHTTFVTPIFLENDTSYTRQSKEWNFYKETSFSLYGQIVAIDTCAYIVVGNSLITENEKDNVTYLIYQDISFPPEHYVRFKNGSVRLCWTGPDPPEPVSMFQYSEGQYILKLILFAISSICLLATFCTYYIFKPLRNLQGISIMNFVSALFVAQVLLQFIAPSMVSLPTVCTITAIITHYFLLVVFTWTNILAWDLVRHFASSSFQPKRHKEKKRLIIYLTIGWCLPLIIIIPCLIVQADDPSLFRYGKIGTSCWIYQARAMVLAFLIPFAVCQLLNVVLFSFTAYGVHKSKRDSSVLHESAEERRKELFKTLIVHFKISCLLGFGWSFGFIAAFAQAAAVWTIFIITSSLQGVFVFIFFGANQRVRGLWRKRIRESKPEGKSSSSAGTAGTTTTSMGSRDRHMQKLLASGSPSSATQV